jgi:hypothetical protein
MNCENDPFAIKTKIKQHHDAIDVLKRTVIAPPKGTTANSVRSIHDQIFEHEYHIADLEIMLQACQARRQAQLAETQKESAGLLEAAQLWRELHSEFKVLAAEELRKDPGNKYDRWLRALVSGDEAADRFCSLDGGVDEGFVARFEALATRAGVLLGKRFGSSKASEVWVRSLFVNLFEHKSRELFAATREKGGVIRRVCEASAIYCSRLEKESIESGTVITSSKKKRIPRPKPLCFHSAVVLLRKHPDLSLLRFCQLMDSKAEQHPTSHKYLPPESWNVRSFHEQYKNRSNTVSRFLSAARKAARNLL